MAASGGVTESTRSVIDAVSQLYPAHQGGVPTREVVASLEGVIGKTQVATHLNRALKRGYLDNRTPGRGRHGHWVPDAPLPEKTLLPTPDQVFGEISPGNRPEGREVPNRQLQLTSVSGLPGQFREATTDERDEGKSPEQVGGAADVWRL